VEDTHSWAASRIVKGRTRTATEIDEAPRSVGSIFYHPLDPPAQKVGSQQNRQKERKEKLSSGLLEWK